MRNKFNLAKFCGKVTTHFLIWNKLYVQLSVQITEIYPNEYKTDMSDMIWCKEGPYEYHW